MNFLSVLSDLWDLIFHFYQAENRQCTYTLTTWQERLESGITHGSVASKIPALFSFYDLLSHVMSKIVSIHHHQSMWATHLHGQLGGQNKIWPSGNELLPLTATFTWLGGSPVTTCSSDGAMMAATLQQMRDCSALLRHCLR